MSDDENAALREYHANRCEQEKVRVRDAGSEAAAQAHQRLLSLHQQMYYDLLGTPAVAA